MKQWNILKIRHFFLSHFLKVEGKIMILMNLVPVNPAVSVIVLLRCENSGTFQLSNQIDLSLIDWSLLKILLKRLKKEEARGYNRSFRWLTRGGSDGQLAQLSDRSQFTTKVKWLNKQHWAKYEYWNDVFQWQMT